MTSLRQAFLIAADYFEDEWTPAELDQHKADDDLTTTEVIRADPLTVGETEGGI